MDEYVHVGDQWGCIMFPPSSPSGVPIFGVQSEGTQICL
jgi:hypothetical protein